MAGSVPWRVIAQRILTGEFLSWDVPLKDSTTSRELSGPGGVFGTIEPALIDALADDGRPLIEEWSTALYVEEDGEIRAGGIVGKVDKDKAVMNLEAAGFCGYPNGVPWMDNYTPADFEDPLVTFRNLWQKVQAYPDANLGLKIIGDTSYFKLSGGAGPYTIIATDYKDLGGELNNIAAAVPFDFIERHAWANTAHTSISHTLTQGFPRLGARQTDMRFAAGENIVDYGAVSANGERYSNDVTILGPGEGLAMLTSRAAVRDGRLRRPVAVPVKDGSQGQLDRRAQAELRSRGLLPDLTDITIIDHANARISAIDPGDDIFIEIDHPQGDIADWYRVLAVNESGSQPGLAVLKTQRADAFAYAADTSYDGQPQVLIL